MGQGPALLLLHGSGGATHSWRDVAPVLAQHFTVIAPDLPGHGFTTAAPASRMTLPGIAELLVTLVSELQVEPFGIVGHSAGGAIALWLATRWPSASIVGINAALSPPSFALSLLSPAVQFLARSGLAAALTAKLAESDFAFEGLMRSTGSTISAEQMSLYRTFAQSESHASAVMTMFAGWDLSALERTLPTVANRVTLLVGAKDGWVPPREARAIAKLLQNARVVAIPNAGHLAHEEYPVLTCKLIEEAVA
jgi:magnesium chelatase accessory protein